MHLLGAEIDCVHHLLCNYWGTSTSYIRLTQNRFQPPLIPAPVDLT